jgi:hypothetical protein
MARKPWHRKRRRVVRELRCHAMLEEDFPVTHLALVTNPLDLLENDDTSLDTKTRQYLKLKYRKMKSIPKRLPVETLTKVLPVETLTKELPVETLTKELPVETLTKELPVETLTKEPSGNDHWETIDTEPSSWWRRWF